MSDEDLVYDGRARKRPPGANSTVVQLFDLLATHPEGVTIEIACTAFSKRFPTDGYRSYEAYLKRRGIEAIAIDGHYRPIPQYGSAQFKRLAESWWLREAFRRMVENGTARREGDRWFKGDRAPLHRIVCEVGKTHMVPYDSDKGRAEDAAYRHRARVREEARAVLAKSKLSADVRKALEQLMEIS